MPAVPRFRPTSRRVRLQADGPSLRLTTASRRTAGITSGLLALPTRGVEATAELDARDAAVRAAFLRIACYRTASGRSRQLWTRTSRLVAGGGRARVTVRIERTPPAVAYRVRVLARLAAGRAATGSVVVRGLRLAEPAARPRPVRIVAAR